MKKRRIRILALIGSPRKHGNTGIMADEVLEGARSAGAVRAVSGYGDRGEADQL